MQTEQLLCWSDMTDTEQTTSGSNKEKEYSFICSVVYTKEGANGQWGHALQGVDLGRANQFCSNYL